MSSDTSDPPNTAKVRTERGEQRDREDDAFVPVFVKRTDESRRHPDEGRLYDYYGRPLCHRGQSAKNRAVGGLMTGAGTADEGPVASVVEQRRCTNLSRITQGHPRTLIRRDPRRGGEGQDRRV
jgi:hypothetical protein